MITRLLFASTLLLGATVGTCKNGSVGEDDSAGSEPAAPAGVGSEPAAAEGQSPTRHGDVQLPESDFHPVEYDFHRSPDKQDQVEFDLVSTSHSAMVLVVECQPRMDEPDHCKKTFNPESRAPIDLPIKPHCGKGSDFDCSVPNSSFAKHRSDTYFPLGYAQMTGAFIPEDRIITAAHKIDERDLDRLFFVMNLVQRGHHWPTVDRNGDGRPDHARIDPRFVLAVEKVVDCEFHPSGPPDWAIFEVRPLLADQAEIPEHADFDLAEAVPPKDTKIGVLAHPRLLPLKLADGIIIAAGDAEGGMTAAFDVSQGSSGSPALLFGQDVIVGINRVRSRRNGNGQEKRCSLDDMGGCDFQPLTPATRIRRILDNPNDSNRVKCHLKGDTAQ